MKKIEIVGLSVVSAALLLTGCGSSSDSKSSPTAPSDVTAPLAMDLNATKNVMALATQGIGIFRASSKVSAIAENVKTKALAISDAGGDSGTETFDCTVSGTRTQSWNTSWSETDAGWSETVSETTTYNHCVDNYNTTINGEDTNLRTYNGSSTYSRTGEYDNVEDVSKMSISGSDNYTETYESNETLTSRTRTSTGTINLNEEADGTWLMSTSEPAYNFSIALNITDNSTDVNSTGSTVGGEEVIYALTMTSEGLQDDTYGKDTANGFYSAYDINSSGDKVLMYSDYFGNYMEEYTSDGANEHNMTVTGTRGSTCLGGSVTVATNLTIQENQQDYQDENNNTGSSVLPYSGVITLTGTGASMITFDHNETNNTSATVSIDDVNTTFGTWGTLADGPCGGY